MAKGNHGANIKTHEPQEVFEETKFVPLSKQLSKPTGKPWWATVRLSGPPKPGVIPRK